MRSWSAQSSTGAGGLYVADEADVLGGDFGQRQDRLSFLAYHTVGVSSIRSRATGG